MTHFMRPNRVCPWIVRSTLAMACMVGVGCKTKAIRGGVGTENPQLDEAAMGTGLDRRDLQDLMRANLEKLFASPLWVSWKRAEKPPVIAIWPIKNDTTEHLDDQLLTLLSDMETEFINSGTVTVVSRERQSELAAEVGVQNTAAYDPATMAKLSKQVGASHYVTGKLQATDERINKERRVQYTLFIQVLEVETSLIKFQHKTERSKAVVR